MLFSEIIGQESLKNKLIQTVRENRISHARLFLGPEGAGSLPLAIAYARYINCTDRSETDSCGKCFSCIKYGKLAHPDLHFAFPVIKPEKTKSDDVTCDMFIGEWREAVRENPYLSYGEWLKKGFGGENKQANIFTKEAAEILRKINFKAFEAQYKVMIIWMAERMRREVANKILKILEEPPEKTLFLLIAESPDLILPTILSRTQLTRVPKVETSLLADYLLRKGLCNNRQEAENTAILSNGNVAQALASLQQANEGERFLDLFIRMMRICWKVWSQKQAMIELMKWCDEATAMSREMQKAFLSYCLRMVRENFMYNIGNPQLSLMSTEEQEFAVKFNAFIHPGNVVHITNELNKAYHHIEANANTKIMFLDMACKIVMLLRPA
ncbi:MAG: DNA polymerase III subunit delta [Bacteroidales bacterium]|jgi:DNA polymerase-3 subunit delta'|nr:DNA polymerase III subunit delta [Bacteroidales bacterium]